MGRSIMLDIETMGITPDSVVLTVGAVKFDPLSFEEPTDTFYLRLDVDEQTAAGRTVDESTLKWWEKQAPEVIEEAFSPDERTSLAEFRKQFCKFINGCDYIWSQGSNFDIGILENLFRQNSWNIPWNHWQIMDSRTVFTQFGDHREKNRESAHNALEDARAQVIGIQRLMHKLGKHREL